MTSGRSLFFYQGHETLFSHLVTGFGLQGLQQPHKLNAGVLETIPNHQREANWVLSPNENHVYMTWNAPCRRERSLFGLRDRLFTVRPRPHCIVRTGWPQYSCMNEADAQHSHEAMSYDVRRRWRRPSSSSRMAVARGTASNLDATVE